MIDDGKRWPQRVWMLALNSIKPVEEASKYMNDARHVLDNVRLDELIGSSSQRDPAGGERPLGGAAEEEPAAF